MTSTPTTTSHDAGSMWLGPMYVYVEFVELIRRAGWEDMEIVDILASRWSRVGDQAGANDQRDRVFALNRHQNIPGLDIVAAYPDDAWDTVAGRLAHTVMELRVRDVTPYRFPNDPQGNALVGHLALGASCLVFRAGSSGLQALVKVDGGEMNVYTEAMVQLARWACSTQDMHTVVNVRLAEDPSRKGRLVTELGRLDREYKRMGIQLWNGTTKIDLDGYGELIEGLKGSQSQSAGEAILVGLIGGSLDAVGKGNIPLNEKSLPPTLRHLVDPDAPGLDKRVRDQKCLVTAHDVEVQPALFEYITALSQGLTDSETLAEILVRHRVPTTKVLPPKEGGKRVRHSSARETTFDRLTPPQQRRRAARWLISGDYKVRIVPQGASAEVKRKIEWSNRMAFRCFEAIESGEWLYTQQNSLPTHDSINKNAVIRESRLDPGRWEKMAPLGFPLQHVVVPGPDGVPVVTDEIVFIDGEPVEWTRWGLPTATVEAARRHLFGHLTRAPSGGPQETKAELRRVIEIDDWNEDGVWWKAFPRTGQTKTKKGPRIHHTALLVWCPSEDIEANGVKIGWTEILRDIVGKSASKSERYVGAWHEGWLLASFADALEAFVRRALIDEDQLDLKSVTAVGIRKRTIMAELSASIKTATEAALQAGARETGFRNMAAEASALADADEKKRCSLDAEVHKLAKATFDEEVAALHEKLREVVESDETAELDIRRVSELIALLRRCASQPYDGFGPKALADVMRRSTSAWRFKPIPQGFAWSCRLDLPLADHTMLSCDHFEGIVGKTGNGVNALSAQERMLAHKVLAEGQSIDEVLDATPDSGRSTSRWRLCEQVRDLIVEAGAASYRATPLVDHPFGVARQAWWAGVHNARPDGATWSLGYERLMVARYVEGSWGKSACPIEMSSIHSLFEFVASHGAAGVMMADIALKTPFSRDFVTQLISPSRPRDRQRGRPKMLEWVPGKVGFAVRCFTCPHQDCPGAPGHRFASIAVYLPETASEPGEVGGVLCPDCLRLPLLEFADVFFPPDYAVLVTRLMPGKEGSVRVQALTGPAEFASMVTGRVQTADRLVTPLRLADEYDVSLTQMTTILEELGVPMRRQDGKQKRFYDSAQAQSAVEAAQADGRLDMDAYSADALWPAEAQSLLGLSASQLRLATKKRRVPVHLTIGGRSRYLAAEILG